MRGSGLPLCASPQGMGGRGGGNWGDVGVPVQPGPPSAPAGRCPPPAPI